MPDTKSNWCMIETDQRLGKKYDREPVNRWRGEAMEALRVHPVPKKTREQEDIEGENTLLRALIRKLQQKPPTELEVLQEVIRHNKVMIGIYERTTTTKAKASHGEQMQGKRATDIFQDRRRALERKTRLELSPIPESDDVSSLAEYFGNRYPEFKPQG